jgi:hypothetical protein
MVLAMETVAQPFASVVVLGRNAVDSGRPDHGREGAVRLRGGQVRRRRRLNDDGLRLRRFRLCGFWLRHQRHDNRRRRWNKNGFGLWRFRLSGFWFRRRRHRNRRRRLDIDMSPAVERVIYLGRRGWRNAGSAGPKWPGLRRRWIDRG